MNDEHMELRAVPKDHDIQSQFLDAAAALNLQLAGITPTAPELAEEIAYYDLSDGSRISLRRDRITSITHILCQGMRAQEFLEWTMHHIECWTRREALAALATEIEAKDIDGIVDQTIILFMTWPGADKCEDDKSFLELANQLFEHLDPDVRDTAIVGAFFGAWRNTKIQEAIRVLELHDPAAKVRQRAALFARTLRTIREPDPTTNDK